jgi:hypothetical protein
LLLAVGVAAIVVMWTRHVSEPVTVNPPTVDGKKPVFTLLPTPVPKGLDKTPPQMVVEAAGGGQEAQKTVQVKANQVLATVNRIPVTLKDLVGEGRSEARFVVEEYEYLLSRAVEREAAFQAALSQGVTLTDGQMRQLEKIHERVMGGEVEKDGSKVLHVNAAGGVSDRSAFAVRNAAGLMLIVNLMAKVGLPSDVPEHRSAYIKARLDFLAKLRADHVVAIVPTTVS